jgi:hypothetical protein
VSWPPPPGAEVLADLAFDTAATPVSGSDVSVALVFGAGGTGPGADQPVEITGRFVFRASVQANVDAGVHRGVSQRTALVSGPALATNAGARLVWDEGSGLQAQAVQPLRDAAPLRAGVAALWDTPRSLGASGLVRWDQAEETAAETHAHWAQAAVQRLLRGMAWDVARAAGAMAAQQHQQAERSRLWGPSPWHEAAPAVGMAPLPWARKARSLPSTLRAPWDGAATQSTFFSFAAVVRPAPVAPPPPQTLVDLLFCQPVFDGQPTGVPIIFKADPCGGILPGAPLTILPARFYMAVHSLQAWRLPDLLPIPVLSFGFQADQGSFGWSFDVTTRLSAFDDLAPASGVPARLRVEADGLRFEMVIDSLAHSEAFGQRSVTVSGRSPTALLASPYARETERLATAARNAQQLALEALEATGFALDWTLHDWLVPAGAWSHSGTPLAAVQAIVSAAGGYLQSHRSADTLIAAHPYPDLPGGVPGGPWAWSDPAVVADVELAPSALVATRIERADGPDINGVYVSGQTQGVLRLYKRSGSAADRLASLVTDPLITADVAARMRGRAVVGAAGPKQRITASLPVLTGGAAPGILSVGQLLQVNAAQPWRGRVRAVSGRFEFGQEVRQQVQIERHLGV